MLKLKYDHELILKLLLQGMYPREICKKYNIPAGIISHLCKKNNIIYKKGRLDEELIITEQKNGLTTVEISKKLKISLGRVHFVLKKYKLPTPKPGELSRKHHIYQDIFEKIDTEEKAYWLGFLYADGYNCQTKGYFRIVLQYRDESHIKKFCAFINYNSELYKNFQKSPHSDNWSYYSRVTINSRKLSNDLADLGCVQAKSLILKFPTNEQVPKELLRHFIRGYFDGDGSVFISNEKHHRSKKIEPIIHVRFIGTEDMMKNIQKECNIGNSRCIIKKGNIYEYIIKRKIRAKEMYDYLYLEANVFLERKKEIFKEYFR